MRLDPLVCSSGLPEPSIAPSSTCTDRRWSASAALTTPSAARASRASTSSSSRLPGTGSIPRALSRSRLGGVAHQPAHRMPGGDQADGDAAADVAGGAGDEQPHVECSVPQRQTMATAEDPAPGSIDGAESMTMDGLQDSEAAPKPTLVYPFEAPPARGQALEVAPGVRWIRMPLPYALNHINLWALDDGDGWAIVDTGVRNEETVARLARAVRQRARRAPADARLRHPHAPRPRRHGRLADAQVRHPPVDDAARVPDLPRDGLRHRPRGAGRRDRVLSPRRLGRGGDRDLPRPLRQLRQAHPRAARQLPADARRRRAAHRRAHLARRRRQRPLARARLPVLPGAEGADLGRPDPAAHLVERLGPSDRARRRSDERLAGLAGQAQARGSRRRAGAAGAQRVLPRPACAHRRAGARPGDVRSTGCAARSPSRSARSTSSARSSPGRSAKPTCRCSAWPPAKASPA